jgi:hypothetical protein
MNTHHEAGQLPEPPTRELPRRSRHREELLAMIDNEDRPSLGRRYGVPISVAAAVGGIIAGVATFSASSTHHHDAAQQVQAGSTGPQLPAASKPAASPSAVRGEHAVALQRMTSAQLTRYEQLCAAGLSNPNGQNGSSGRSSFLPNGSAVAEALGADTPSGYVGFIEWSSPSGGNQCTISPAYAGSGGGVGAQGWDSHPSQLEYGRELVIPEQGSTQVEIPASGIAPAGTAKVVVTDPRNGKNFDLTPLADGHFFFVIENAPALDSRASGWPALTTRAYDAHGKLLSQYVGNREAIAFVVDPNKH